MKKSKSSMRRDEGISLLEIMIVLAIIALIMGLVAPRVIGYFGRAKSTTAELQMTQIKGALQLMYIDIGRYPTEAEGLDTLLVQTQSMTGWKGPYLDDPKGLIDPWSRVYRYRIPGDVKAFDLLTFGRDGQQGGDGEDADLQL